MSNSSYSVLKYRPEGTPPNTIHVLQKAYLEAENKLTQILTSRGEYIDYNESTI